MPLTVKDFEKTKKKNISKKCQLCFEEFQPKNDRIGRYCPECREKYKDAFFMAIYELNVAKADVKHELYKTIKESILGRFIIKILSKD